MLHVYLTLKWHCTAHVPQWNSVFSGKMSFCMLLLLPAIRLSIQQSIWNLPNFQMRLSSKVTSSMFLGLVLLHASPHLLFPTPSTIHCSTACMSLVLHANIHNYNIRIIYVGVCFPNSLWPWTSLPLTWHVGGVQLLLVEMNWNEYITYLKWFRSPSDIDINSEGITFKYVP